MAHPGYRQEEEALSADDTGRDHRSGVGIHRTNCRRRSAAVQGTLPYLKRTTVKIPDSLDARLRHEARRRNLTISEVSREALEAYLGVPGGRRRLNAAAAGRSGRSDVSERIEEILAAEVGR
jgi:hypothetical protein